MPLRSLPLVLPTAPLSVSPVVAEVVPGASSQSMWTGLFECCFAAPVSLSASLPAFGFLNELQSGFDVLLMELVEEPGSLSSRSAERVADCDAVLPVAWSLVLLAASAGRVAPSAAARAIVLRNWLRIMRSSSRTE